MHFPPVVPSLIANEFSPLQPISRGQSGMYERENREEAPLLRLFSVIISTILIKLTIPHRYIPVNEYSQRFVHPEWSASVWGRARARLAERALELPIDDIVALSTDCIWSRSTHNWVDGDAKYTPGSFRIKDYVSLEKYRKIMKTQDDWLWPKDWPEMLRFIKKYKDWNDIHDETLDNANGQLVAEMEV